MILSGKTAIITGANKGFGLAIAKEYIKEGASIAICARDETKLKDALSYLNDYANKNDKTPKILGRKVDVSSEEEVKSFVSYVHENFESIDILVNNAGVYGPKGLLEDTSSKEWVHAIEINLFGVFYMCKEVLKIMRKQGYGRIINLSGGGATAPLPRISSYAASKAAVVRLTETLAEEYKNDGIFINAIAPGALNTGLLDEVLSAGEEVVGKEFYQKALKQKSEGGASLENGAKLCVYLAGENGEGISGKLISAVWDPWKSLHEHVKELSESDVYTLRRIVPKDRNIDFE